mmetsp:Transcript_12736/g.25856  ORF Transcript_12736/g.25856 Transcript_12736/m.25856 type:complete len:84 (+) Transcript_12736:648-899(+)
MRKRKVTEVLEMISENSGKKLKDLIEELGLETDEDAVRLASDPGGFVSRGLNKSLQFVSSGLDRVFVCRSFRLLSQRRSPCDH